MPIFTSPPMVTFDQPPTAPAAPATPRLDPCVWLAALGLACLIAAVVAAVAARDIGPAAIVFALAALVCLGFGVGAIAGEVGRGRLQGLGNALALLGWAGVGLYVHRTAPPVHHCHHDCC